MTILVLDHVGFSVSEKKILENISFTVNQGEWVTLIGPSGSGKSTILKLLAGLDSATSGEILYDGKHIETLDLTQHRKDVSYFFQQATLFGETVEDNLAFPFEIRQLPFDKAKAVDALKSVNLSEKFLVKKVRELSGGEKQRVALVRNLMFEPNVLLLDEISAGLDSDTKQVVRRLLQAYHQSGHTIIEVTHDAEEIALAKRTINISGGRLTHEQ